VVAGITARLIDLPRRAVVLAEDETHLKLLAHVRASWTLRGMRPQVLTPGTNRNVTVPERFEVSTGRWVYRQSPLCGGLYRLVDQLLNAFPLRDRGVLRQRQHLPPPARSRPTGQAPRLELLYNARYSPHDNRPNGSGALNNYVANTAVSWVGRLRGRSTPSSAPA
jgi:hypothetical protein